MTDTTTVAGETASTESRKVAEHDWLGPDGSVVDDIEAATGYRYKQVHDGQTFDWYPPVPKAAAAAGVTAKDLAGSELMMVALFGTKTKAINWSSQLRGDDRKAPIDVNALAARFGEIRDGAWPEREGGGGGRGYDLDKLAEAIGSVMERKKKAFNHAKVRAALESGGTLGGKALDAKQYRAALIGMEGVRAAYERLMGKATKVDDVAGDLA